MNMEIDEGEKNLDNGAGQFFLIIKRINKIVFKIIGSNVIDGVRQFYGIEIRLIGG